MATAMPTSQRQQEWSVVLGDSIRVHTRSVDRQGERLAPCGVPWLQVCGVNLGIVLGGMAPHWFLRSRGAPVSSLPRFYSDPSPFRFARGDFCSRLRTLVETLGEQIRITVAVTAKKLRESGGLARLLVVHLDPVGSAGGSTLLRTSFRGRA